ncbi:MAG: hypothetical protein Q9219_005522 [cf. Caloplaca sp. 3 TL-2023]
MKEHCGLQDGILYFQPQTPPRGLENYLKETSQDFTIHPVESETPGTQLWSLASSVKAAEGKVSGITDTSLGLPRSFGRWFSLVRIWTPWLAPSHGEGQFNPTQDAMLSAFLRLDGLHLVLLAISGVDEVLTVFKPDEQGNVIAHCRNDSTEESRIRVLAAVGTTFNTALAAVMYHARKIVRGDDFMSPTDREEMQHALEKGVKAEWMEEWYDGLTYCTWNALGQDLTEQKIFDCLNGLKDNGIQITNLIIDDNWQSLDNHGESQFRRGMTDFEANKEGFPSGLRHAAIQIRDRHPNIKHIAVWHALLGYWGGMSPTGTIANTYKTRTVRKADSRLAGGEMTVVHEDDVARMYDDFYRFLLANGIDSVKTDAQFFLDRMDDADDRRRFMKTYQDAWTIASLRYFGTKGISCMSQLPQILFHTQLPTNKPRLLVRNSDDFFPDIPASHPFHIFTNALTCLFTSHLNVLPDWDMFQTSHPYSSFHAAARCISGGPIYITDTPGHHDLDLIASMTAHAVSDDPQKTIILRPNQVAKCIEQGVYNNYHEPRFLQIGNYHAGSTAEYGTSFLGVFNISDCPLTELIPLSHFPGVVKEKKYIIRAHPSGEISSPLSLDDNNDDIPPVLNLALETKGWALLTAYPILSSPSTTTSTPLEIAILGLLGKITAAAAVVGTPTLSLSPHSQTQTQNLHISLSLRALGTLGVYISALEAWKEEEWNDHILVLIRGRAVDAELVSVEGGGKERKVLSVDVEGAWRAMGLGVGWNREVEVEVVVSGI